MIPRILSSISTAKPLAATAKKKFAGASPVDIRVKDAENVVINKERTTIAERLA